MIEITDKRDPNTFRTVTFSGYKKTEVKKQLHTNIMHGKVEQSLYWCAELICGGQYIEIWDTILTLAGKHIHYGNPKLPIYLEKRFEDFKSIIEGGFAGYEIKMRNSDKIRKLFAEIMCILCFSQKKHSFDSIKIDKDEFDITQISYKLRADSLAYITPIFMSEDPKECFIAGNELAYCVTEKGRNSNEACYWIEWISEFESICARKKTKCVCERRSSMPVDGRYQTELVWFMWDILLHETSKRDQLTRKIMKSLLTLFCLRYTSASKKKRRFILYTAVYMLTEKINALIPICTKNDMIHKIVQNLDPIYKELKKNEVKPETDYMYHGVKQSSLERTIAKLETMNNIGFIPRG